MQPDLRTWLRVLAAQDSSSTSRLRLQLKDNAFGDAIVTFSSYLCEASEPARLLPPYAALLRSLVTRQGELAVTLLSDGRLDYSPRLRRNLQQPSPGGRRRQGGDSGGGGGGRSLR